MKLILWTRKLVHREGKLCTQGQLQGQNHDINRQCVSRAQGLNTYTNIFETFGFRTPHTLKNY